MIARIGLLILVVPLAEEAFLRAFLLRFLHSDDWSRVALSQLGWRAVVGGGIYGIASHPNEALAALFWFSLVGVLMIRTGKFWNCVLAHAITNGLLGVYLIGFGQWQLW